jgi:hypothetical protein
MLVWYGNERATKNRFMQKCEEAQLPIMSLQASSLKLDQLPLTRARFSSAAVIWPELSCKKT